MMGKLRLVPLGRDQELAGHNIGALMDQLVEGVLAIGSGLAPDHRARGARKIAAVHRHPLAVTFHLELLEIGGQSRQALIIGQHRAAGMAQNLPVPDPCQSQKNGQVFRQRRLPEMRVHRGRPGQHFAEARRPDGQHQRQADRPPHGIAPADPILEPEDAVCRDPEGSGLVGGRG